MCCCMFLNCKSRPWNIELTIWKFLVPPRWILEPTDKAFAQGSDAKVECKADGFPKPVVTWKKATGALIVKICFMFVSMGIMLLGQTPGEYKDFKPNNPDIKVEDGTLIINNIQKTNEGYYLCEAVNGIGSGLSAVILINVQGILIRNTSVFYCFTIICLFPNSSPSIRYQTT